MKNNNIYLIKDETLVIGIEAELLLLQGDKYEKN